VDPIATLASDPGSSDHTAALDIFQAINRLNAEYRTVIVLRYFAGMDATEVGAALALPSGTVRTRLRRALALLRNQLTASGDLPSSLSRKRDTYV
jgi:DNA-directed RNA polymerase specialized sigma24 family protein